LRERSLEELLWHVVAARDEGCVVMRDRDGLRHVVWIQTGYVVGLRVAGRFDPLLDVLRRRGVLDEPAYQGCVDALWKGGLRAGEIAMHVGGVTRAQVRDALRDQACQRMQALLELANSVGHDAWFESLPLSHQHVSVRMPLGALLRAVPGASSQPSARTPDRADDRRKLRELAKRLHPDRNSHLDAETRSRLERDLAQATARYHGFT
jgi:hypothetical protein